MSTTNFISLFSFLSKKENREMPIDDNFIIKCETLDDLKAFDSVINQFHEDIIDFLVVIYKLNGKEDMSNYLLSKGASLDVYYDIQDNIIPMFKNFKIVDSKDSYNKFYVSDSDIFTVFFEYDPIGNRVNFNRDIVFDIYKKFSFSSNYSITTIFFKYLLYNIFDLNIDEKDIYRLFPFNF